MIICEVFYHIRSERGGFVTGEIGLIFMLYAVLRNVCFKGSAQVARKSSEYFHFAQQSQLLTCQCHLDQRTENAVIRFPASRPC